MSSSVLILSTGTANTASVGAGLERAGARASLVREPADVERAERLVLPGVGSFASALQRLEQDGLVEPLRRRLATGRPTLAICLGLQLLGTGSDESPGVRGLGLLDVKATRFASGKRIPHLGWNRIANSGGPLLTEGDVYFANSFRWRELPPAARLAGWQASVCNYEGESFVAAVERGAVLACQFHPELSGSLGRRLLTRWLACGYSPIEESSPC